MMNFPANGVSIAQTKSSLFLSSLSTTPGQEETILKWETKKKIQFGFAPISVVDLNILVNLT